MLHESPLGMGIAHDHDNVYWYNDGFYNELVRYDFQQDQILESTTTRMA